MKRGLILSLFCFVVLSGAVSAQACAPNQTILKLSSESNAHGELWDQGNYDVEICHDVIFGEEYNVSEGENPHLCNGNNSVLNLSVVTNAHAEGPDGTNYDVPVCYGESIGCTLYTGAQNCPPGEEEPIVYLSAVTNAHLSNNSGSGYNNVLCCFPAQGTGEAVIVCGNGFIGSGETCDDGNTENGDGCDQFCQIETGWNCTGQPSSCDPICGDGLCTGTENAGNCPADCSGDIFWSDLGGESFVNNEIDVVLGETNALMNLLNGALTPGTKINFGLYHDSVSQENFIRNVSTEDILDGDMVNATWDILFDDVDGKDLDEPFYFEVEGQTSGPLTVNILSECFNVNFCSDYESEASCNQDELLCKVGDRSVESNNPNITCGDGYECFCEWDTSEDKCGPTYVGDPDPSIPGFNPDWTGQCLFDELSQDTCSDDFLTYSWEGTWNQGSALTPAEVLSVDPANNPDNFVEILGEWYYDPKVDGEIRESAQCNSATGDKTVPCPTQVKLPFFGFWNLVASISLIAFVYAFFRKN